MHQGPIDFGGLAAALLERAHIVVPQWLPRGVERMGRWYIGDFDGNDGESANVNLRTGQWIDNGAPDEDVGRDLLSLYKRVFGHHTMRDAALAVMAEMGWLAQLQGAAQTPVRNSAPSAAVPPADMPADLPEAPHETPAHAAAVASTAQQKPNRWTPVVPVPQHVQSPTAFVHSFKDTTQDKWVSVAATVWWEWWFEGQFYGYTARFDRINSKGQAVKDILPLTWCKDNEDPRGGHRWHWKQWTAPRPLYLPCGLLAGDPALIPVVVCEGEKKALAGHQLLGHEFDFLAWPGGAKAWPLASWSWLKGRTVYLWPDADAQRVALTREEKAAGLDPATKAFKPLNKQAGYQAMVGIGQELLAQHWCTVFMLPMEAPGVRPDGWDLADAIAEGWDAPRVRDHIRSARVFVPPDVAARAAAGVDATGAGISTPSMAAAGDATGSGGDDRVLAWTKHLLRAQKTDAVTAVRENVVTALDGRPDRGVGGIPECAGLIAFNEFTNQVTKRRPAPWGTPDGDWLETDELMMGDWLVREHFMPSMSRQALEEAVLIVAKRHSFHPVRERVEAMRGRWDKVNRLDTWLRLVCLEEDEWDDSDPLQQYLKLAGRWFLMAMVARVMSVRRHGVLVVCGPGTKFDYMLILEGPQGWGKSSLARLLGGEYFADTGLDIGNKDSLMNIQGIWVYEWGELENLTKQEVGKVKLFVSSPEDRFRATFDKRPARYPRQVVFIGTTNEAHYLTDTTGNRRFWPVRVTRPPDLDYLRDNLEQLLAEAVHRVHAGERFYPDRNEQRLLFDPQQSERTVESSLESSLRSLLFDEDQTVPHGKSNLALVAEVSMQELLDRAGFTIDKQTDAVVKKAGALMHMLGWAVRRTSEPGRPRKYVRPKATDRQAMPGGSPESTAGRARPVPAKTDDEDDGPPF